MPLSSLTGDTIVYVPDARTAWTGNHPCHAGVAHMLLQGGPQPYLGSLRKMREALPELETIVPGHRPMGAGLTAISVFEEYLARLDEEVPAAVAAGSTFEETIAACTNPWAAGLDPVLAEAMSRYPVSAAAAQQGMLALCQNLHRLSILATYRLYEAAANGRGPA